MQIITKSLQKATSDLKYELPKLFFEKSIRAAVEDLQKTYAFDDELKERLIRRAMPIEVIWNGRNKGSLYTFKKQDFNEMDILEGWSRPKGHYLSHFSALYFNNLIEQRPNHHYISQEIPGKGVERRDQNLDSFKVRQAFLKPSRVTTSFFKFKEFRFYVIEKMNFHDVGVATKKLHYESVIYDLRLTSPERTLLDCIISPQYAGGISNVVSAFSSYSVKIDELMVVYKKINPIYPYWQTIGFLLQRLGQNDSEKTWKREFRDRAMIPFFLDHSAKSSWSFSKDWQIHYPNGVFSEANY